MNIAPSLVSLVYLPRTGRYTYRISSNNSRPSINRLPRIIAPPPYSSRHLLFLLSTLCQVEVESDQPKLISDDSSSENVYQGTKFGTL